MSSLRLTVLVLGSFTLPLVAGCGGGGYAVNNEASTSAIRSAEETGASNSPSASYYLSLAKQELEDAGLHAAKGNDKEAESMLLRAQVDAELALVLSLQDADKKDAAQAIKRYRQLREDYRLFRERK